MFGGINVLPDIKKHDVPPVLHKNISYGGCPPVTPVISINIIINTNQTQYYHHLQWSI